MKDKIEQILIDADIMGLIRLGAPRDEYHEEAKLIADRMQQYDTEWTIEQVAKIAYDVFTDQFCSWESFKFVDDKAVSLGIRSAKTNDEIEKIIGKFEGYLEIGKEIKVLLDE